MTRTVLARIAWVALLLGLPSLGAASPRHAAQLLRTWQFDEARTTIAALMDRDAGNATHQYLAAESAFLDGDYPRALALVDRAQQAGKTRQTQSLRSLIVGTMEATHGFTRRLSNGGHFAIYFQAGKDEVLVDLAGDALERAYAVFAVDFGVRPTTPIRVEILDKPADLAKVSTLTEKDIRTTSTTALCKYNKLMAVTPRATVFGYAWIDTLVHEYVHYVVSTASRDTIPVWLHEGLARYAQTRWRTGAPGALSGIDKHLLASALAANDLVTFKEMHPSMAKLPSREKAALAYAEVTTFVAYFHGQAGMSGIREVLRRAADGEDARTAVAAVLGAPWSKAEGDWRRYLRGLDLRRAPALSTRASSGIQFKVEGRKYDEDSATHVPNTRAASHLRLGGMLRARGLHRAAVIEYEKAHRVAPGDPVISTKLAHTYVRLAAYDKAIALAEPLLKLDDNDPAPATTLGIAYLATGNYEKAAAALERSVRINPFNPRVRCGLRDAYTELSKSKLATRESNACKQLSR